LIGAKSSCTRIHMPPDMTRGRRNRRLNPNGGWIGGMGSRCGSSKGTVSRISSSSGMESGTSLGVAMAKASSEGATNEGENRPLGVAMAKASSEGATKEKTEGQAMIENVATLLKQHGAGR
jgi:hypothetical protein